MLYIQRGDDGKIQALSKVATSECNEHIAPDAAELRLFLDGCDNDISVMEKSDMDLVRVVEDLIELLIAKNYILFTELPEKAREKINKRRVLRGDKKGFLDLLDDDSESMF